ncbi:phage head-tail adapter protein [Salininema proteolyticum]|uniref:Phage head-tail adapter protein n=1 Tax=Salininema proteolyticum TaxID=1607685 RepID=A0ABV8TZJ7_9ACTN
MDIRGQFSFDRSSRMEVPGQSLINFYTLRTEPHEGLEVGARLKWRGRLWDVESPPARYSGPRATAHVTVTIRERVNS